MKAFLSFFILVLSVGCTHQKQTLVPGWKTIELGNYLVDFPLDFVLQKENGIDSYVGKIISDSMSFWFDFGYYSDDFAETPKEYLKNGRWKHELPYRFMQAGTTYDDRNSPKVHVISFRKATARDSLIGAGCDYVATFVQTDKSKGSDHNTYEYAIFVPEEIKALHFAVDTIVNQFRKIVWAKNPHKGTTGIYLRNLSNSGNNSLALSISTTNLTDVQQRLALKIYKTARLKK